MRQPHSGNCLWGDRNQRRRACGSGDQPLGIRADAIAGGSATNPRAAPPQKILGRDKPFARAVRKARLHRSSSEVLGLPGPGVLSAGRGHRASLAESNRQALALLLRHACERITGQPESRPFVQQLGANLLVERDGELVPVEHRPVDAAAIPIDRNARELAQKSESNSVFPEGRLHEEIFEIDPTLAEPGGVVVKVKREPGGLVPEVRDQDLGGWAVAEKCFGEVLLGDRGLARLRFLVLGELENELSNQRNVAACRRNDARLYRSATHSGIIRLAESGVNAIFRPMTSRTPLLAFLALLATACNSRSPQVDAAVITQDSTRAERLPTDARLDPAGVSYALGPLPLAMVLSPDKSQVVVLLNGWREQGIQIVDKTSGRVLQKVTLPAVFLGLTFSPDAKSLYVSGGNQDVIYRFDWTTSGATLKDSIALAPKPAARSGTRDPGGLALSPNC